jgi:hypothetical protein
MAKFTPETALAALELQQLVADWCHELDFNGGLDVTRLFTEDCVVEAGKISYKGHAAMQKFYADRAERIRTEQKDGVRTSRHLGLNLRYTFAGADRASVSFLIMNFSGSGGPPIFDTIPSIVTDVRFECRREADGRWRIAEFHGEPVFIGSDPFQNAAVVKR